MPDTSKEPEIFVQDLHRIYRVGGSDVRALRGVNLAIDAGEFIGIVGVSGSGKSTLLHLLGGLDSPTSGQIRVAGQDLGQMSAYQRALYRRAQVGFVFQSFYLVPNLSAKENIRLALTFQGTYGSERERLAADAITRVGLAGRAKHRPGQLSGGEQQRVTIARAIVHRPRVLLADEPTGNLDRRTATALMDLIDEVRRETSMTVLMVTHDEALVTQYCDRLIRMSDGQFVHDDAPGTPHAELQTLDPR